MSDPFDFESELNDNDNVGLDAEDRKHVRGKREEWFKGEKGVTYRVSLVYFYPLELAGAMALKRKHEKEGKPAPTREQMVEIANKLLTKRAEELSKASDQLQSHEKLDLSTIRFKRIKGLYKEGLGYVVDRRGKDGPEADEVWKSLGDPKNYFCTVLLVYPTNREGEIQKDQLANLWNVKPWRASSKSYESLIDKSESLKAQEIKDLSIANQDLTLKCTNTDFQNFDIEPVGKALWRKEPRFQAKVLEKAVALYEKLTPFRELSTADLRIKLGMSSASASSGTDVGTDEFAGLLEGV